MAFWLVTCSLCCCCWLAGWLAVACLKALHWGIVGQSAHGTEWPVGQQHAEHSARPGTRADTHWAGRAERALRSRLGRDTHLPANQAGVAAVFQVTFASHRKSCRRPTFSCVTHLRPK